VLQWSIPDNACNSGWLTGRIGATVKKESNTFGEYLDFHLHLHALVADGLFVRSGMFHVVPRIGINPLEKIFRARLIAFLAGKGLSPPERALMLMGWKPAGCGAR